MTSKPIVIVGYDLTRGVSDTHPLVTYIADAEDGAQFSDTVNHRDMRQVRAYYNGWCSAVSCFRIDGPHHIVELDQRGRWPYAKREFHMPVNFEYQIAEAVPAKLRFNKDS